MKNFLFIITLVYSTIIIAQTNEKLPFDEIPDYTEVYSANLVAARMIDGLGFRYYWATEGLRDEDLTYKPSESGRETMETVAHIYGLSKVIRNSVLINNKDINKEKLDFLAQRKQTLLNIELVSNVLKNTNAPFDLEDSELPFWNIINGPISDALWHCGQLVLLRRASGNPFNSKVNLFNGKVRE